MSSRSSWLLDLLASLLLDVSLRICFDGRASLVTCDGGSHWFLLVSLLECLLSVVR